jgi:SAM-dependent methyltransferase
MDRAAFAEMAATDETHWWFKARRAILEEVILRLIKPCQNAQIVEIGCGTGSNLQFLTRFGQLTGIEPDDEARAFAAARSSATVVAGFLPAGLPVADGSADMAAMLDVLEHIDDDLSALKAVATKLKPGAALLITVPAFPFLWSAHDVLHHHKRRYTAKTLRQVIVASGLVPEKVSYFTRFYFR